MKAIILIFFLLPGARAACLSGSLEKPLKLNMDVRFAEDAVQSFEDIIREELPLGHSLVINLEPLNPKVNAEIVRKEKEVSIKVLGGMLGHERMSHETLMLLLCHEIGHLLGGPPLKSRNGWSSTEGQADYYSTLSCARKVIFDDNIFFESALALTTIYADVSMSLPPRLDICDERKVERTNYGYPSVQCRLDTLVAGWFEKPRPQCWFYE